MRLPIAALGSWMAPVPAADEVARTLTAIGLEVEGREETVAGTVLEINVTPNRGDCLSVRGIARELCAALGRPFADPAPAPLPEPLANSSLPIALNDPRCPRFLGVEIRGVKKVATPDTVKKLLEGFGMRPVSMLVDAANLVMLELGQPLHTYDLKTLRGGITVRAARAGETLVTLDGQKRELTPWSVKGQPFAPLLICDDQEGARPIGLAGVMGGGDTEIPDHAEGIYLEAAAFDPVAVRRMAKRYTLHSEASHRFERGVDPHLPKLAAARFLQLLKEWGGGGTVAGWRLTETVKPETRTVELRPAALRRLLGAALPADFVAARFAALGLKAAGGEKWVIPGWRPDLGVEEDLIEEAGRHYGYDRIGETLPSGIDPAPGRSESQNQIERLRTRAITLGFTEHISVPFVDAKSFKDYELSASAIRISNPIWLDKPELRFESLLTLLPFLVHNLNPDVLEGELPNIKLFEICTSYLRPEVSSHAPIERIGMTLAYSIPLKTSPYERRRIMEAEVKNLLGLNPCCGSAYSTMEYEYEARRPHAIANSWKHPVKSYYLKVDDPRTGKAIQKFGSTFGIIEIDDLSALVPPSLKVSGLPKFPAIIRDLNLLVPQPDRSKQLEGWEAEPYLRIKETARHAGARYLENVKNADDGYFSKELPAGFFSLTVRFKFRNPDDTLTAEEAEADLTRIRAALEKIGVTVRG